MIIGGPDSVAKFIGPTSGLGHGQAQSGSAIRFGITLFALLLLLTLLQLLLGSRYGSQAALEGTLYYLLSSAKNMAN